MGPSSGHVPRRRRPRLRLGLACQRNAAPPVIPGIPAPLLAVPVAGNGMSAAAPSPAACLEAPTDGTRGPSSASRENGPCPFKDGVQRM